MEISRRFRKSSLVWKRKETSCPQDFFVSHLSALRQSKVVVTSCGATHPCSNRFHLFPPRLCTHCSQGDSSRRWLLHLPSFTWGSCGGSPSSWQPLSNLSVRFPPHSPRKPFFERKAKIKYSFVFRSWKWTHLYCPLILTSLGHHFTNTNLRSFEYVEIYIHAVPWDVMPPECPFILVHPLGTKSESEHHQKIDRQPFYEIIFKRKMSAKHLSDLKNKNNTSLCLIKFWPVSQRYFLYLYKIHITCVSIKYILHVYVIF